MPDDEKDPVVVDLGPRWTNITLALAYAAAHGVPVEVIGLIASLGRASSSNEALEFSLRAVQRLNGVRREDYVAARARLINDLQTWVKDVGDALVSTVGDPS